MACKAPVCWSKYTTDIAGNWESQNIQITYFLLFCLHFQVVTQSKLNQVEAKTEFFIQAEARATTE